VSLYGFHIIEPSLSIFFYIGKNSSIDVLWQFETPALYKFTQ